MEQKTKSEDVISQNLEIPMTAEIKAFLLSVGTADIEDDSILLPTLKSTAGPSAGSEGSVFIYSNGRRVRLNINKNSPLKIRKLSKNEAETKIAVIHSETNELIVTGENEPVLAHCPRQAYINLSEKCIYNCKYCSVPKLQGHVKTKEESLEIIKNAFEKGKVEAISITSGVENTPEGELNRVLELMPDLLNYGVPIGVSIYAAPGFSEKLKASGVSEVKYNIEVADSKIFEDVCPGLSMDDVFLELKEAVCFFGKGKVYSNLIIGLGETDESVEKMIEKLAEIGVISCVRPIYLNPHRAAECFMERPSPERLLKLFEIQKWISQKYDLHPEKSETMCSLCTGCDMVPGRDD
jgi:Biotin synthase-related enzyme